MIWIIGEFYDRTVETVRRARPEIDLRDRRQVGVFAGGDSINKMIGWAPQPHDEVIFVEPTSAQLDRYKIRLRNGKPKETWL